MKAGNILQILTFIWKSFIYFRMIISNHSECLVEVTTLIFNDYSDHFIFR